MPEVKFCNIMSVENHVDDLNLDFSDRKWETRTRNGGNWVFEFKFHESDSESEARSSDDESVHDVVDLDDEYFFDNKIDFSHYLPKLPPEEKAVSENKNEPKELEKGTRVEIKVENVDKESDSSVTSNSAVTDEGKSESDPVKTPENSSETPEDVKIHTTNARRNDREEIRKKLAMGTEDDGLDDDDDDDITYKKSKLQSRLHSGLQICFMNESPGDTDNEGVSPRQHEIHDNAKLLKKVSNLVDSDNNLSSVTDLNNPSPPTSSIQSTSPPRLKEEKKEKVEDFHTRQEQLQNEAKVALAQAGSMAHMQLEIEKQLKKKSPMAEMVGIPGLGEKYRKKLSIRQLQQMNLASIQVLYNDLQTQIESLNEELVHLLMERDELHMEQDSMLVDIEDLTRRAEELAKHANMTGGNKGNKSSGSAKGKMPAR